MKIEDSKYQGLEQKIALLEQELLDSKVIEKTLLFLAQRGWENPKERFFEPLAIFLAEILDMDYVCIDKLYGDCLSAKTFTIYFDGKFEDNVTYTLKDTPCGEVVKKTICCFPYGVRHQFQKDIVLQEIEAESYIGTTLFDSNGNPIGLIAIIGRKPLVNIRLAENILKLVSIRAAGEMERLQAEDALKESEENLRILNADKDRFLSILAHDLRNPFNALLGLSDLLLKNLEKSDTKKIETQLKLINLTAYQTFHLLEDLLLWSNSQAGKLIVKLKKINANEVCTEIIGILKNEALQKEITLHCSIPENIDVMADENQLKAILRNLISNAIKFTHQYGIIQIEVQQDANYAVFTVSDNGVGIEKENQEKLWNFSQPFTTIGTAKEKGTGLGLLLCKEFVEKHGGKIWVESQVGKGSDFKFTIPLAN